MSKQGSSQNKPRHVTPRQLVTWPSLGPTEHLIYKQRRKKTRKQIGKTQTQNIEVDKRETETERDTQIWSTQGNTET